MTYKASAMIERFKNGEIRERAPRTGLATTEQMDEMIKGLERWMICEDASMALVQGELVIQVV